MVKYLYISYGEEMRVFKVKNYLALITSLLLCDGAYAQYSNMQFPQTVGTYSPNARNMNFPNQVGVYQQQGYSNQTNINRQMQYQNVQNRFVATPYARPVVDYNRAPTISQNIYNDVKGYQTPNRYTLQNASRLSNNSSPKNEDDDFGTEYYMSLGYGFGKFTGDGLTNSNYAFPVNNISEGLGDPKSITFGFGVMENRNYSLEVNYTALTGLSYDKTSYSENQFCGPKDFDNNGFYFDCSSENPVSGGGISSNSIMLSVHIPLKEFIKDTFLDGIVSPYIAGSFGMAFNTINDYTVSADYLTDDAKLPLTTDGIPFTDTTDNFGWYNENGKITHFGATTNNLAYSIEAGLTFNLDKKTMLDVYYKINNNGTVESKDMIYYTYDMIDIVDATTSTNTSTDGTITDYCTTEALDAGYTYNENTGWCELEEGTAEGYTTGYKEKGKIQNEEMGVKLRLLF